jgi:hypothetical protein
MVCNNREAASNCYRLPVSGYQDLPVSIPDNNQAVIDLGPSNWYPATGNLHSFPYTHRIKIEQFKEPG